VRVRRTHSSARCPGEGAKVGTRGGEIGERLDVERAGEVLGRRVARRTIAKRHQLADRIDISNWPAIWGNDARLMEEGSEIVAADAGRAARKARRRDRGARIPRASARRCAAGDEGEGTAGSRADESRSGWERHLVGQEAGDLASASFVARGRLMAGAGGVESAQGLSSEPWKASTRSGTRRG